jgi:hypothetical protein
MMPLTCPSIPGWNRLASVIRYWRDLKYVRSLVYAVPEDEGPSWHG